MTRSAAVRGSMAALLLCTAAASVARPQAGQQLPGEAKYEGAGIRFLGIRQGATEWKPAWGEPMMAADGLEYAFVRLQVTWSTDAPQRAQQVKATTGTGLLKLVDVEGKDVGGTPMVGTAIHLAVWRMPAVEDDASPLNVEIPFLVDKGTRIKEFVFGSLRFPNLPAPQPRKE